MNNKNYLLIYLYNIICCVVVVGFGLTRFSSVQFGSMIIIQKKKKRFDRFNCSFFSLLIPFTIYSIQLYSKLYYKQIFIFLKEKDVIILTIDD